MSQISQNESVPTAVRDFFSAVEKLPPEARQPRSGSHSAKNGTSTGSVSFEGERVVVKLTESLRLEAQNYAVSRGSIVEGIASARTTPPSFLTVRSGECGGSDDKMRTISNLELALDPTVLGSAFVSSPTLAAELDWLWSLLRLVLRLKHRDGKTIGEWFAQPQQAPERSASAVTPVAPVPVVAPAAPVADPLAVDDDDFFVDTSVEAAADPMAALNEGQRELVEKLQAGMSTFDIKASKIRGDELRAALAFQRAGGVFTRETKGRDDKPITGEVRVGMDGRVNPVAKSVGVAIKKGTSALDKALASRRKAK